MFDTTEAVTVELPKVSKARTEERRRIEEWLKERYNASDPVAEIAMLTPVMAEVLLANNHNNRPLSRRNSLDLEADIANNRFVFNGESIVVSNTGKLLDGQHRCEQVIKTGRSIKTVLVFGVRESARFTIDTGKSKTAADFLGMKGRPYNKALAACAGYHIMWSAHGRIETSGGKNTSIRPTKKQIVDIVDELPGIGESVEFTAPCIKTTRAHAILAFCHYVIWKKASREAADHFIGRIIDGVSLRAGSPILYVRNKLINAGRGALAGERVELIFRAWNLYRNNMSVNNKSGIKLNGKIPKVER